MSRNAGAQWAIPSENEWYKAAYHQPASQGGDSDNYWRYPTSSNSITTAQANYNSSIIRPVGSYAANFYGTFDMGGNLWEWNEAIHNGSSRGWRGGGFMLFFNEDYLESDYRNNTFNPSTENAEAGFRVVQVPAPSAVALLALGGVLAGRRRRN